MNQLIIHNPNQTYLINVLFQLPGLWPKPVQIQPNQTNCLM